MGCLARAGLRSSLSILLASALSVGWLPSTSWASERVAPEAKAKGAGPAAAPAEAAEAPTPTPDATDPGTPAPVVEPQPVPPPDDTMPAPTATELVVPAPQGPAPGWDEPQPAAGPTPIPAPTPAEPKPAKPRPSRAGLGMLISGFSLFGATWLISAFIGAAAIDISADEEQDEFEAEQKKDFGTRLMIPVGGPFAAAFVAPNATAALVSVLDGVAQVTGLTLGIVGSVMVGRARARRSRMGVSFSPAPGGGYARFGMRF